VLGEALRKWVTNGRRKELLAALWELALGHYREETDKDGQTRVYRVPPSPKAIELIFDRIDGKAPQALELTTPDGGLLVGRMTPEERREYLRRVATEE